MPPKVKFTKDEIIQAALNVARVKGASSVSTRDIAAELQVSTRPIFTYFDTMDIIENMPFSVEIVDSFANEW